jgi:hypothetical protein
MSWIQRLFTSQSHALATEADRWTARARVSSRRGHHKLAAQCRSNAAAFAEKQRQVVASAREAHMWSLEHKGE